MQKTITYIEYAMFTISVISVFFIMFMVGDTDVLAEPPTWVTLVLTGTACLSATIGAVIHWAGVPINEPPKRKMKRIKAAAVIAEAKVAEEAAVEAAAKKAAAKAKADEIKAEKARVKAAEAEAALAVANETNDADAVESAKPQD
jgi:hypothetical protein